MRRLILSAAVAVAAFMFSQACSDRSGWRDPLIDSLTDYDEIELVTFNIAGNTTCDRCKGREADIIGVKIEVIPKDEPLKELAIVMFDSVGPFTIPNMRYKKGAKLTIRAQAYTGLDAAGFSGEAYAVVPDEDGATAVVAITL